MKWSEIDSQTCSVARTLSVIGDRWSLLILRDIFLGTRRFEDLCKQLGVSRPALTQRLRKLEQQDVLHKRAYQDKPTRFEYHLTEKGVDLYPIIMTMAQWGDKWQGDGNGPPIEYQHKTCGHKTQAVMCCSECDEPLNAWEVSPQIGPGLKAAMAKATNKTIEENLPRSLRPHTGTQ
ncbi:MAG: DNA-binding HxlR family transcriptional regulator [Halioglobus sp.]|jgi:DNA-binding HxlR family transcriptional regulator